MEREGDDGDSQKHILKQTQVSVTTSDAHGHGGVGHGGWGDERERDGERGNSWDKH